MSVVSKYVSLKNYIPIDGKYAEGEKKFMGMCKLKNFDTKDES